MDNSNSDTLGTKWSRNLSANNQSEINRMRQITKQKMENKKNRNQQSMITSTRQQSARTIKSSSQRKIDLNDSSEELTNSSSDNVSIDEKLNKEKLIDQFKDNFGVTNQEKKVNNDRPLSNSKKDEQDKKFSSVSQTHSAEEDNLDLESSEDENLIKRSIKNKKIEKSKSTFNLSDLKNDRSVTNLDENILYNKLNNLSTTISTTTISNNLTKDINPLKSLLNNSELLQFVVDPVPRNKVYQCTIIRDKKGLDRSLYPTYYMHLQTINSKDDNQQLKVEDFKENNSSIKKENGKDGLAYDSSLNGNLKKQTTTNNSNVQQNNNQSNNYNTGESHNRQVFLLSGRRRKKSKTYLISCNPFEITRTNSIAKLKSNVLGTQFNTVRITQTNRTDYATIIYDTNVLGFKGPRRMTVILPKIDSTNYHKHVGLNNDITLIDLSKADPKTVIKLKNKTPVWNEETQSYVLNFKGRVTQASVKNFQLEQCDLTDELENRSKEDFIENGSQSTNERSPTNTSNKMKNNFMSNHSLNDFISMQFGRISNKEFTCDVSWPLSLLQAFSIALSSFDSKLACE